MNVNKSYSRNLVRNYKGFISAKKEANFNVKISSSVTDTILDQNKKDKVIDADLLIKRVIADSCKFLTKGASREVFIELDEISTVNNEVTYKIIKKDGEIDIHSIKLAVTDLPLVINEVVSKKIMYVEKPSLKSILERFDQDKSADGVGSILSRFFRKILDHFHFLEQLWEALTGQKAEKMDWDMRLLSEVSGSNPFKGMRLVDSLKYISGLLLREKSEMSDPELNQRIKNAIKISEEIDHLSHRYKDSACTHLIQHIQRSIIRSENEKVLIPVGYVENGELLQMLLEVKKDGDKCTVTLIGGSAELRDFFDHEMGVTIGTLSVKREIVNVDLKDLLASVPTFIGLQVSPLYTGGSNKSGMQPFLQALKYQGSTVAYTKPSESNLKSVSRGHFNEVISYVKEGFQEEEDSSRFELAARLHFFLDVCKNNKEGMKDKNFWQLVRTTAHHLAAIIEKEKGVLGDSLFEQGVEMTKIYHEIQGVLASLDENLPLTSDLGQISLPPISAPIDVDTKSPTPLLTVNIQEKSKYPKVKPEFSSISLENPLESITDWGDRLKELIKLKEFELASREAKMMVRMLPKATDPFWKILSADEAKKVSSSLLEMGRAIARASYGKEQTSFEDVTCSVALNYYVYATVSRISEDNKNLEIFTLRANRICDDLDSSRIPMSDKLWLRGIRETLGVKNPVKKDVKSYSKAMILLNQYLAIAAGDHNRFKSEEFDNLVDVRLIEYQGNYKVQFKDKRDMKSDKVVKELDIDSELPVPIHLLHPSYADDVSNEISNRYLTEFCPLGCIRDNCPNYADVSLTQHRFYPLYMVHNFVDTYCPGIESKNMLYRDEIIDLLYLQQTNQNANMIFDKVHNKQHGFKVAKGFNKDDQRFQLLNTLSLFVERPHFLKYAELRWFFETKLFNNNEFSELLASPDLYSEHKPFIMNIFKRMSKEIKIAETGNIEVSLYLMNIVDELKEIVEASPIPKEEKEVLFSCFKTEKKAEEAILNMAKTLIRKNEPESINKQIVILTLLLNHFHKRICKDGNDDFLKNSDNLELLICSINRLEGLSTDKENIDPELRNKYQSLMALAMPKLLEINKQQKNSGAIFNKLLTTLNPEIAALRLKWDVDNFPVITALDKKQGTLIQFDLENGNLKRGSNIQTNLPKNIKKDPVIQSLYGSIVDDFWKVKTSGSGDDGLVTISYSHPKYPKQRIVVNKKLNQPAKIIIERSIRNEKGEKIWISYNRFQAQDDFKTGIIISQESDLPVSVAAAIGDRHCWVDRKKKAIYVFDTDGQKPYAIIKLKTNKLSKDSYQTVITDFVFMEDHTRLLSHNKKSIENFLSIEDPMFIQVRGKGKNPKSVVFIRSEMAGNGATLSYDIKGKQVTTEYLPGYHLAPFGTRPGKGNETLGVKPLPDLFDNFHLFVKDGSEKVLIPKRQFEQVHNRFGRVMPLVKRKTNDTFEKNLVYEYTVNTETNRLIAKSADAYAYLAYICFVSGDHSSASIYLEKAKTVAGYDEKYLQIFDWVKELDIQTPNGVAMQLKFELFRENVLTDLRIRADQEGIRSTVNVVEAKDLNRTMKIADLYGRYLDALDNRKIGVEGHDPSLDLTLAEEKTIARLIKKMVDEHGPEQIEEPVMEEHRAEEINPQHYLESDAQFLMKIREGALLLWAFKGNSHDRSSISVKNPRWIIDNFNDTFNRLLELDTRSLEYKQLVHQIRLLSEMPVDGLTKNEKDAIQKAQYYLLKLVTAKKQKSPILEEVENILGKSKRLQPFSGAYFQSSRIHQIDRARYLFTNCYDDQSLQTIASARKKSKELIREAVYRRQQANEEKKKKVYLSEDPNYFEIYHIESLAKKVLKLADEYELMESQLRIKGKNPQVHFSEFLRDRLLQDAFGENGNASINSLNDVFKKLDKIAIAQDVQKRGKKPKTVHKKETFESKYGKLIDRQESIRDITALQEIENEIQNSPPVPTPVKIISAKDKILPVIGEASLDKVKGYFTLSETSTNPLNEEIFDELSKSPELAVARLAEEHRADMRKYQVDQREVSLKKVNAEKVKNHFKNELATFEKEKENVKKNILQFVERNRAPAGMLAMRRLIGASVKNPIDKLVSFWLRNEITEKWENNPLKLLGITEIPLEELQELDEMITAYLELTTKVQHTNRIIAASKNFINSCSSSPSSIGDAQLAKGLFESIDTKRFYSLDPQDSPDFRDFLFIESNLEIILRPSQVDTLRDMISDPNAVRQLEMGGGKSKVLLPWLAKRKATGKNLVLLLLPESLYETNSRDLDNTNRELFGQTMYRFDFKRGSECSEKALRKIRLRMTKTIRDKGYIMSTKKKMLSFRNASADLLVQLKIATENNDQASQKVLIGQIREMVKINKIFREQTDILADEVDACLDVRKKTNFSIGDSKIIDQDKVNIGIELFEMILFAKDTSPLHELSTAIMNNTQAALTPERRGELLKELVKDYYIKHGKSLSQFDQETFSNYILNSVKESPVEAWVFSLMKSDPPLFKQIASFKAFIDQGLVTTLGRVGNVQYGRDPVSEESIIPFKASDTPDVGSEFDDDIEKICFHIQGYLQTGVTYKQVYKVVARLQAKAVAEMRGKGPDEEIGINETKAAAEFNELIKKVDPEKKLGLNSSLGVFDSPAMVKNLTEIINETPQGRLSFCRDVLGRMKQFDTQINSESNDVVEMVNNFSGFTGTPWNLHTYHDKIHAEKRLGVDGRTWALLLGRDVEIKTFNFDPTDPIGSLLKGNDVIGNFQAVIDTGAYLRGTSNNDFIDKCFELAQAEGVDIKGGIYFDSTGKIVKKLGKDDKPLPIEIASPTDLAKNITIYDQAKTVGADIKQHPNAIAIVTVGEGTFIRDLFQAIWRLRQLHEGQRIVLTVSEEIKAMILNGEDRDITIKDILKYCLVNEAKREDEDNFRSEKDKIQGSTKRLTLKVLLDLIDGKFSDNDEAIIKMASEYALTFVKEKKADEELIQYAKLKRKDDPVVVFNLAKKREELKCDQMAEGFKNIDPETAELFMNHKLAIANRQNPPNDWFPNKVANTLTEAGGGEIETEAENETEAELELMLETETETETHSMSEKRMIPMVRGAGAHGDVVPISEKDILGAINRVNVDALRRIENSLEFFDKEIFSTSVFERNIPTQKAYGIDAQTVFYSTRKIIKNVFISKDEDHWTMILPTIHEAHGACRDFIKANPQRRTVEVAISEGKPIIVYKSGDDRTDELPFQNKEDLDHFYRLYVQAKLFNGEINYETEEEKEALKLWLEEKGAKQFRDYFEQKILAAKPMRFAELYQTSSLNEIFRELIP